MNNTEHNSSDSALPRWILISGHQNRIVCPSNISISGYQNTTGGMGFPRNISVSGYKNTVNADAMLAERNRKE